jgi:hypothetical protein
MNPSDPAPRAVHALADAGDQHHHQQQQGRHEQPGRVLFPGGQRHLERDQRRHKGHQQEHVPHQEVRV